MIEIQPLQHLQLSYADAVSFMHQGGPTKFHLWQTIIPLACNRPRYVCMEVIEKPYGVISLFRLQGINIRHCWEDIEQYETVLDPSPLLNFYLSMPEGVWNQWCIASRTRCYNILPPKDTQIEYVSLQEQYIYPLPFEV